MIRSQLIQQLADDNQHLTIKDCERIVVSLFDEISVALARGDRVELRGFGAFTVRQREARDGRNPKTGEFVEVPAKRNLHFRPGKDLKNKINK